MRKRRWNRWPWPLVVAAVSMLALMALAVAVTDAVAGHAVAAKPQVDWKAQLTKVDEALGKSEVALAVLRWPEAYAAALNTAFGEIFAELTRDLAAAELSSSKR